MVVGYNQNLFSWGLFNLFSEKSFSREGLEAVENFNPDRDILYLPQIADKNIFQAMDDLSICRKPEVRKYIYIYLTRGRQYTIASIERSHTYAPIIAEVFKKNQDIPADIALLPLLESGFNPHAVSRSRAVGLWQFIASTARPLGLKNDAWVDERKNIEKSTEAALRHLRHLYAIFKSWDLALIAYNGGAGHLNRAMAKAGTRNVLELTRSGALSSEASEYLYRYIAMTLIYKNQRLFDIHDEIRVPEAPKTETYTVRHPVSIDDISRHADVPRHVIEAFNPELLRSVIPPYWTNYPLRVPAGTKDALIKKEKELYSNRISGVKKHRVRPGESLSKIAQQHKITTARIIRYNSIRDPDNIRAGSILYIPF
jgi:membrane-bound lytic murein transglycosylase D